MRRTHLLRALATCIALGANALWAQEQPKVGGVVFEPPVQLKAGEQLIDTGQHIAHAGPLVVDLNNDHNPDLLVGNFSGYFQVYMNQGTRTEPQYEDKGLLLVNGEPAKVPNW